VTALIQGIGELPLGRSPHPSAMALHEALVAAALDDAECSLRDVDVLLTVCPRADPYLVHAEALAERLGIHPQHCYSVEAGGTAPVVMLSIARSLIESGEAAVAVIVAADAPLTGAHGRYLEILSQVGPAHPQFEQPFGVTPRSLYALMARAYLNEHRLDETALAAVALHDRAMAGRHPNSQFTAPMTAEDYFAAPLVCDPLRRLDCAPPADGGAAIVMTAANGPGGRAGRPGIRVAATGGASSHAHVSQAPSLTQSAAGTALDRALDGTRLRREDIDVALVYDCFTIAMLMNVESLGFAKRGGAGADFRDGRFSGQDGPRINTHGGLLSHGYPARAAGIGNLVEAVVQLRGEAGERQVPGCGTALVHGMSGAQSSHAVALLRRGDEP
jgi:acetyl-CoA acetyltransferase